MTLTAPDFIAIALYFVILIVFGVLVRRIRTFGDYAVGGRAVPAAMVFASLAAAYIGPGYTMGFAGKGYETGYLFFFVALAFTTQTVIVGLFLAPRLHAFENCYTLGDIFGTLHGRAAHLLAGLVSFILCVGFVSVMAKVGGLVLHGTLGWPVWVGVAGVTAVGALYSFTGGIKAVIATEALQFSIFAIAVPVLLLATIFGADVDLSAVDARAWEAAQDAVGKMGGWKLAGVLLSFFLGETLIPPYANRALAADSSKGARRGFLYAAAFSVVWFGMVVAIGVVGAGAIKPTSPDGLFMALANTYLPPGLVGLTIVAIVAIIMSSQESVLNAGAVSFTRDIWGVLRPKSNDAQTNLTLSRVATLAIALFAAIVGVFSPSIIDALLIIYSIWAPSVLPPLVLALLLKRPPRAAALPAMALGGGTSLLWQFALSEPGGVPAVIVGLVACLTTYALVAVFDHSERRG